MELSYLLLLLIGLICGSYGQLTRLDCKSKEIDLELHAYDMDSNKVSFPHTGQHANLNENDTKRVYKVILPLNDTDSLNMLLQTPKYPLVSPGTTIQWQEGDVTVARVIPTECLYEGFITVDTGQQSTNHVQHDNLGMIASLCGGLTAIFQYGDCEVRVKPSYFTDKHVIKISKSKERNDDAIGHVIDSQHLYIPFKRGNGATRTSRQKRGVFHRNPRHMEVLLVTDVTVARFHGRSLVDQYLLTLMNIVNSAYHHSSLGFEINVIVVDIVHLSDDEMTTIIDIGEGQDTLQNFCNWSSTRWHRAHEKRHTNNMFDVAVYLTKKDLGPAGYAPVTGMCNPLRSCAVIRDDGISSAFVVAHEIGHIFGMVHDGDGEAKKCASEEGEMGSGKIMSAMVQSNYRNYYWSNCSREMMENVLEEMYCLDNEPGGTIWPRYSEPYGQTWTLDEQCRQEFGAGFVFCTQLPPNCEHLWCENPDESTMCRTKRSPPLSGTTCGKNMWCLKTQCVHKKDTPRVDGDWSEWSDWGECSRSCSVGVQYRYRTCSSPTPQYGGKQCDNAGEDFKLCNLKECPIGRDFRWEQCQYYNEVNFAQDQRHNWIPIESKNISEICKLTCISEETKEIFTTEKNVVDGTPCSYESSHNICIQGECQVVGCDKVLRSGMEEDQCGVCGGNGSECITISKTYTRRLHAGQYHSMLTIPVRAMNIRIRENTAFHLAHFLAVRDVGTEKFWLNGDSKPDASRQFVVHKTRFLYFRNKNGEYLTARGPLLDPVEVLIYSFSDRIPVEIDFRYYLFGENQTDDLQVPVTEVNRYRWLVTSFDECTRPCGGGSQREMFVCIDVEKNTVSEGLCSGSERPGGDTVPCNTQQCTTTLYLWEAMSWQKCSQSCGGQGLKWRNVYCEASLEERQWEVEDVYCDSVARPDSYKQCNRMSCPAQWKLGEWSQCSRSCGEGEQTRGYLCDKPVDKNRYTCDHLETPITIRACRAQPCPGNEVPIPTEEIWPDVNVDQRKGTPVVTTAASEPETEHNGQHNTDLAIVTDPGNADNPMEDDIVTPTTKSQKRKKRKHRKSKRKNSSGPKTTNSQSSKEKVKDESIKNTEKKARTKCEADLSGLVCRLAANRRNCASNPIYKTLCCKSCMEYM